MYGCGVYPVLPLYHSVLFASATSYLLVGKWGGHNPGLKHAKDSVVVVVVVCVCKSR
jgi:hypothetical protein